jgi:hypothetical protein
LWIFLSQVLSADQTCRNAVARFLAFRTARGEPPCSTDSGSYCEARQRLPEKLLSHLVRQTGQELHQQAPEGWCVHGRRVKVVDGTTVSMPDTPDNEAAFGKPHNQRGASRFPAARLLVVLCLATGAALELVVGPCRGKKTGELSMFRSLDDAFQAGEIVLGDRLFCTFFDVARLHARGVDVVFRLSSARKSDFRRGQRLGKDDHLVTWSKPVQCPKWMSATEYAAAPDELRLREVRVQVKVPGFRVKSLVVVTTLLDAQEFPLSEIGDLFRQRWHAELDLRSIKTVMQMDVLRCQTAEMVRKEIWTHLLAYNLLRSVMGAAAEESDVLVRHISFKGTLQLFNAFHELIVTSEPQHLESLCTRLLRAVAEHPVGHRPNRYEPRKRKRPLKPYPLLMKSRAEERKQCL